MQGGIKSDKIIYPELSYKIMGILFEVYNELGYGYKEKYYQKAVEVSLVKSYIKYVRECPYKIRYKGEIIGRQFIDFVIEDLMVLELKKGHYFSRRNFEQVESYLKVTGLKLAILANFISTGVVYKRVLNIY
jgi:GxxExxY protein